MLDKNGNVIFKGHNLITNSGKRVLMDCFLGNGSCKISSIRISSNPETPSDSKTEDPNKEENNDTSDIGTTESETPTTGEEETTNSDTTTEEGGIESITE